MSKLFLLHSIRYQEYLGEPKQWTLNESSFGVINLIVGRNSSGKSRTLNLITSLANLINGKLDAVFERASFNVVFSVGSIRYHYDLTFGQQVVIHEQLHKGSEILLYRDADGSGKIFAEEVKVHLNFKLQPNQLALVLKRDAIQHPFLEEIHQWALSLKFYRFGSDLGQGVIFAYNTPESSSAQINLGRGPSVIPETHEVAKLYAQSYDKFQEPLDQAILKDMNEIGYECTDVGADQIPNMFMLGAVPVGLYVKEKSLATTTIQMNMSTGMYRAFALIIHLNVSILEGRPCCINIDDIGEGLDYERAAALIKLLIRRCHENHFQLLMSSNDRFVMNAVDLKHWHIIDRKGSAVNILSYHNRREIFEEFKYLGMNNFDFFANKVYEGEQQ